MVRVLGIDPGTGVTGYGFVERDGGRQPRLVECGVIQTGAGEPLAARLRQIHQELAALVHRLRPTVVAVESVFHARNVRTTLTLSHARGVILLTAEEAGLPIAEYAPALVKKTVTGRGAAPKSQVGFMVAQLLHLRAAPRPADAADGVAIAVAHLLLAGPRGPRPAVRTPP